MFQTQYAVPPPYYMPHDYRTPPATPPATGPHAYYSPRHYAYTSTPAKGHTRRATGDATFTYTYTTPQKTSYYTPQDYYSPSYRKTAQPTSQRKPDYVSDSDRYYEGTRHERVPAYGGSGNKQRRTSSSKYYSTRWAQSVYDDYADYAYESLPRYEKYPPRPPPYERHQSYHHRHVPRTDRHYYDQVPIYTSAAEPTTTRPRPRRSSHTQHEGTLPRRPRPSTTAPQQAPPKATEEDARRAGIPAGYSYKNWDPTEEPILLLGSVFDANSLGKWIYDWTVFFYGPATPMSEVAGELWLLLIQLAGKVKRAEEVMSRIRQSANRDLVDDFLESGERLWQRFNKLLKVCENYMWKAAKRENGNAKNVTMGKNSGCEFVDSIFGRDRELEKTEKLMTGMRLWSMRFDANCEEIIRNPAV
ncbi:hypothetical protein MBLNU230_g1656t1 [Neophaeotheca triangularis]